MKTLITRSAIILAIICATIFTSCSSTGSKADQAAELAHWANVAITAAEIGGVINPSQAALVRKGGALLIDQLGSGKQPNIQVISAAVIDYAQATGKLTPEQVAALKAAGTVPLVAESPLPTILPALPAN